MSADLRLVTMALTKAWLTFLRPGPVGSGVNMRASSGRPSSWWPPKLRPSSCWGGGLMLGDLCSYEGHRKFFNC
eukprot:scaffold93762_cov37-Prasinocladus_malaysianus.AAC.1